MAICECHCLADLFDALDQIDAATQIEADTITECDARNADRTCEFEPAGAF